MKGKKYVLIITTILMGLSMLSCSSSKKEKVGAVGYNHIREMATTTATAVETATPDTATATVTPVEEEKKAEQEDEKVYTTDTVNMRENASLDSPVIEVLQTGTEVKKISEKDGWTKVKRGETEGYIVSQYLTVTKPEINEVVEENNNAVGDTGNSENNYVAENNSNSGVVDSTPQSKPSNSTNNTQSKPSNNNIQSKPENNQSSGESNQGSNTQPTAPSQPEESNPPKQEVIMRHNHWGEFPSTDTYYGTIFTDKDCSEGYSMTVSQYNKFKSEGRIGITTYYESVNGGEVHSEQVEYVIQ